MDTVGIQKYFTLQTRYEHILFLCFTLKIKFKL